MGHWSPSWHTPAQYFAWHRQLYQIAWAIGGVQCVHQGLHGKHLQVQNNIMPFGEPLVQGVHGTEAQPHLPMGLVISGSRVHNAGSDLFLCKAKISAEIVLELGWHKIHGCGCGK